MGWVFSPRLVCDCASVSEGGGESDGLARNARVCGLFSAWLEYIVPLYIVQYPFSRGRRESSHSLETGGLFY